MSIRRLLLALIACAALGMPLPARAQTCGATFPQCDGSCAPSTHCETSGAGCACVPDVPVPSVPTLSPWGIAGMGAALVGLGVLALRRRRARETSTCA
jgi:hypothetical protein